MDMKELAARDKHQPTSDDEASTGSPATTKLHQLLQMGRVEERGIQPVPVEQRTSTRFFNIFTIWFSIQFNILG